MSAKFLAVVMMVLAVPSMAAGVDRRANHLQQRINQGENSGALTGREAMRLQRQENHLRNEIARDKADGRGFTARERAKIQRQENRLSRRVYVQKHDAQVR